MAAVSNGPGAEGCSEVALPGLCRSDPGPAAAGIAAEGPAGSSPESEGVWDSALPVVCV